MTSVTFFFFFFALTYDFYCLAVHFGVCKFFSSPERIPIVDSGGGNGSRERTTEWLEVKIKVPLFSLGAT